PPPGVVYQSSRGVRLASGKEAASSLSGRFSTKATAWKACVVMALASSRSDDGRELPGPILQAETGKQRLDLPLHLASVFEDSHDPKQPLQVSDDDLGGDVGLERAGQLAGLFRLAKPVDENLFEQAHLADHVVVEVRLVEHVAGEASRHQAHAWRLRIVELIEHGLEEFPDALPHRLLGSERLQAPSRNRVVVVLQRLEVEALLALGDVVEG